jgi:hypothetical protein
MVLALGYCKDEFTDKYLAHHLKGETCVCWCIAQGLEYALCEGTEDAPTKDGQSSDCMRRHIPNVNHNQQQRNMRRRRGYTGLVANLLGTNYV